jgi:hypothetical protein
VLLLLLMTTTIVLVLMFMYWAKTKARLDAKVDCLERNAKKTTYMLTSHQSACQNMLQTANKTLRKRGKAQQLGLA